MRIISVTGTKGKTTVVRMIDYIIRNLLSVNTLRVDTDGHYINNCQKSTHTDSLNMINKSCAVCPGRYLIDLYKKDKEGVAILECAINSGREIGIGYEFHDIGVFTNVYEDHINQTRIKNKKDIFNLKSFIVKKVNENGYLIANFDDLIIAKNSQKLLPKDSNIIPFGKKFKNFNINKFLLNKKNYIITFNEDRIILKNYKKETELLNYKEISFTYNGLYNPSIYNLMAVYGAVLSFLNLNLSYVPRINSLIKKYSLEKYGARLVNLKFKDKLVIIDYAHEAESLKEIAKLAHKLGKRVVGVLRLAPDRTNEKILETGKELAGYYDKVIIYDKIDGIKRKIYKRRNLKTRRPGDVSKIFYKGFIKGGENKNNIERIIIEQDAIKRAGEISQCGYVIIIISGDDHKETYNNVKKYFSS